jgi:hypothetical protein
VRNRRPFCQSNKFVELISRQADEARIKKWSFLVDILRAGLEPRLNAGSFLANAFDLFAGRQVILFSAASESKPSILYARGQIFCAERARGKYPNLSKSLPLMHTQSVGPCYCESTSPKSSGGELELR